jgi:Type IV secretion-system coupling protein DNA-binding domain
MHIGNTLNLGMVDGLGEPLEMTPQMRSMHLYLCGATGTGKSKTLEYFVRQDIAQWEENRCGALILDPHGSLYDSLINWIAWNEPDLKDVPIIPIDMRQSDWTIGYNVLRPRSFSDPSVIISNFVQAMAYVWGADGTHGTPLFARMAKEVLWPIYEKKMTLNEVKYLIDSVNKKVRMEMTEGLTKDSVAQGWNFSHSLSPKDFNALFSSTVNRFYSFLDADKLRFMFGKNGESLDLAKALADGQIIIVNLSTKGGLVSEEDASLFATLLLSDLWAAAKARDKGVEEGDIKPFYVYIDEFQNFITPTIAKNLDQARGFGLHLTLANQFPRQILHTGANGAQVYDSVMANARSKLVFSIDTEENLKPLAQTLFMGCLNPDEIKLELYSRKVLDYVEEERTTYSESENWSEGTGLFDGTTDTDSAGGAIRDGAEQEERIWNKSGANSSGTSHTSMSGGAKGTTRSTIFKPIMGEEKSGVHFRPLDEQLYRAMAKLHDQDQRCGVARLVGSKRPVSVKTPFIEKPITSKEMAADFLIRTYEKLPFALQSSEVEKQITEREKKLVSGAGRESADEPVAIRRKIA